LQHEPVGLEIIRVLTCKVDTTELCFFSWVATAFLIAWQIYKNTLKWENQIRLYTDNVFYIIIYDINHN